MSYVGQKPLQLKKKVFFSDDKDLMSDLMLHFSNKNYFGTKLYRQVVGIPMGTNCAPLVADLFLFCYERDFMMSLSDDKQADVIDAFNTTSRYLDSIKNPIKQDLLQILVLVQQQNFLNC